MKRSEELKSEPTFPATLHTPSLRTRHSPRLTDPPKSSNKKNVTFSKYASPEYLSAETPERTDDLRHSAIQTPKQSGRKSEKMSAKRAEKKDNQSLISSYFGFDVNTPSGDQQQSSKLSKTPLTAGKTKPKGRRLTMESDLSRRKSLDKTKTPASQARQHKARLSTPNPAPVSTLGLN